jgi:hypothetical protein
VAVKLIFMARPVLKVKGYEAEQIKALFKKDERYTIGIRLYAIYQVALGQPSRKLEELYNSSFKQITNWVHKFEKEGIDGLRDKAGRGRKSKLDPLQLQRVKGLLLQTVSGRSWFQQCYLDRPFTNRVDQKTIWIGI